MTWQEQRIKDSRQYYIFRRKVTFTMLCCCVLSENDFLVFTFSFFSSFSPDSYYVFAVNLGNPLIQLFILVIHGDMFNQMRINFKFLDSYRADVCGIHMEFSA